MPKINPLRLLKIYTKASRLMALVEEGNRSYAKELTMSKSLFASKTFWFNVVTAAIELSGVLPVPPGISALVISVGNVALRLLTTTPAHVVAAK